jgi:hypothetical protein
MFEGLESHDPSGFQWMLASIDANKVFARNMWLVP